MNKYKKLILDKCGGYSLQHILKIKNIKFLQIDQDKHLLTIMIANENLSTFIQIEWQLLKNNKPANFNDQSLETKEIIYNFLNNN